MCGFVCVVLLCCLLWRVLFVVVVRGCFVCLFMLSCGVVLFCGECCLVCLLMCVFWCFFLFGV